MKKDNKTARGGGDATLLKVVQDLQSAEEKLVVRLAQEETDGEDTPEVRNLRYFAGIVKNLKAKIREAA